MKRTNKKDPDLPCSDVLCTDTCGDDAAHKEDACLLKPGMSKSDQGTETEAQPKSVWPEVYASFKEDPAFWFILFFAGFMQGVQSLSGTATSYLLKDDLKVSPAVSDSLSGFTMVPWVIKPVWGFMSDSCPIMGSRRRAYLMMSGFLGFLGLFLLAVCPYSLTGVAVFSLISAVGTAIASTVAKALLVEKCDGKSGAYAAFLQTFFWCTVYGTAIPTTLVSGYMVEHGSKRTMYALTCGWPLLMTATAYFAHEKDSSIVMGFSDQCKKLFTVLRGEGQGGYPIWKPTLFVLLFACGPSAGSSMFYFFTEELHLDPEFIALSGTISTVFALLGAMSYQAWFANCSYRTLLVTASLLATFFSALPLLVVLRINVKMGIPDKVFIATDSAMTSAISEVAMLPLLVLASRICPPGVEGTLYALLMSISNLGGTISSELSALVAASMGVNKDNFTNLPWLLVISAVGSILPCFLVTCLLPNDDKETAQGQSYEAVDQEAPSAPQPQTV